MSDLNLWIDYSGGAPAQVVVPGELPLRRLKATLIARWGLPATSAEGQPIRYQLVDTKTGQTIQAESEPVSSVIADGGRLTLVAQTQTGISKATCDEVAKPITATPIAEAEAHEAVEALVHERLPPFAPPLQNPVQESASPLQEAQPVPLSPQLPVSHPVAGVPRKHVTTTRRRTLVAVALLAVAIVAIVAARSGQTQTRPEPVAAQKPATTTQAPLPLPRAVPAQPASAPAPTLKPTPPPTTPAPKPEPPPKPTRTIPPTPQTPKPSPTLLPFRDSFNDQGSGWSTGSNQVEFDSGYRQSDYFISIKAGQYSVTRMNHVLGEKYKFDVLQVEGMIENSIEGAYGLVCGWNSNPPTTYHFMISVGGKHSGEYLIERRTQTKRENVIDWTKSSSIKTGRNVVNRVALSSQASVITASVNGSVLATFTDSNQLSGFVGVIAQTFDQASVLFIFDNFYMSGN